MNINDLKHKNIKNEELNPERIKTDPLGVVATQSKIIENLEAIIKQQNKSHSEFLDKQKQLFEQQKQVNQETKEEITKLGRQVKEFVSTNAVTQIKVTDYTNLHRWLFWAFFGLALFGVFGFWWQGSKINEIDNDIYAYFKKTNNSLWLLGNDIYEKNGMINFATPPKK